MARDLFEIERDSEKAWNQKLFKAAARATLLPKLASTKMDLLRRSWKPESAYVPIYNPRYEDYLKQRLVEKCLT